MNELKVAVIGTGKVAQTNYLPCLSNQPDVSLAYFNRTLEKAIVCADKFGGKVFSALPDLMEWQPDIVMILTREMERYEATRAVLNYRPHRLFFEKPLVANSGQENVTEEDFYHGKEILKMADLKNCETAMVFNYRFFEHSIKVKKVVDDRSFGRTLNISGLVHYACWSHAIDLIHYIAGPISELCALSGKTTHSTTDGGGLSASDVTVAFRTNGDATGTLIGTAAMAWPFPLFELTFNFERGRISIQDLDGELIIMDYNGMEIETFKLAAHLSRWDHYDNSFVKSITAYLESIRKNKPVPVPGIYGLMELQVEAALRRSISLSRPVNLLEEFSLT